MLRRFCPCLFLILFLTLYGCSSIQVSTDFDPEADFSAIHTYSWKTANVSGDALANNPLLYKRIVKSIDGYLQRRGYQKVDPGSADILVAIHAATKEKMRVTDWGGPRGYYRDPWYDPWWGGGAYGGRVDVSYYTEGTLVIDIVDRRRQELIWRGLGTSIVHKYSDPEKMEKAVNEYVGEILDRFPPGYKPE